MNLSNVSMLFSRAKTNETTPTERRILGADEGAKSERKELGFEDEETESKRRGLGFESEKHSVLLNVAHSLNCSLGDLMDAVAKAVEMEGEGGTQAKGGAETKNDSHAERATGKDGERTEAASSLVRQRAREKATAFWTTPGLRPLAEPPIVDWEQFLRWYMPSDLRHQRLFPTNPEMRARMKDVQGERAALYEYLHSTDIMKDDPDTDVERRQVYLDLRRELYDDWDEVNAEFAEIWEKASELGKWEYNNLDEDGQTLNLEMWMRRGANIFHGCRQAVQVYAHLIPLAFQEDPLATFEFLWLDPGGGTARIEALFKEGNDALRDWPHEVRWKYRRFERHRNLPAPPTSLAPTIYDAQQSTH